MTRGYHDDAQIAKIRPRHHHGSRQQQSYSGGVSLAYVGNECEGMMPLFGSAEHWLARAKEAREMAEQLSDVEARRAMLEIANNYEKVAKRAEAKDAGVAFTAHQKHTGRH